MLPSVPPLVLPGWPCRHPRCYRRRLEYHRRVLATPRPASITTQDRRQVHIRLVGVLSLQRPNAPPRIHDKLPQLATKLERILYQEASSRDMFLDDTTLLGRVARVLTDHRQRQDCDHVRLETP
ncbi:Aste57867_19836 [Aphanomyces stellatus]|uniref:Aste57867_19836 protein n=1 Tax=Aphanomyces stellatus TaxID=120398 RepID=A0A485LE38_9STRA|nr:hypothetical protein As57867_019771 [Aphanomyces stellatus]VFT96534.1 Aste57867_19836 [Aphanomyces stellatus]